jgi:DNA (cytosine-5)-methyltransferase 1
MTSVSRIAEKLTEAQRPRLLDLFCCAGGAGMGYHKAGFDVVGVDLSPQPRYPFAFIQHDALTLDPRFLRSFDAIHASPPCQGYTAMRHAPGAKGAPRLISAVRNMLEQSGLPWVIENVEDARSEMRDPIMLCGTSFELGAEGAQLQRHRLFETNFGAVGAACEHDSSRPTVGVYGGHARIRSAKFGGRTTRDVWPNGHKPVAAEAMGMDWATLAEMSEAIPPAYTRFIGAQMIAHIKSERLAA